jgi:large subunit ribosomal protein L23
MKKQEMIRILQAPITSEKSTIFADEQKYVFRVKKTANKKNIKDAVEMMFDVHVEWVHVLNVKGKTKRFGRFIGSRSNWKKAYIKLKPGYVIDLSGV